MGSSITALDNTNGGMATLGAGGHAISSTAYKGYSFTTSASSTWEIDFLRFGARTFTPGDYTVVAHLYATSDNKPAGIALASVSLTINLGTSAAYYTFDKAALSTLGTYTLSAGTGYAMVLSATTSGAVWSNLNPAAIPTATNDFSYGAYVSSSNGISWSTVSAVYPSLQMDVQATCFLRGTLILTARGEVAVEALREGDLVATKFGGLRPIRWIGTQSFEGRLAGKGHQPIRFAPGSLGGGVPSCDLWVSPGHAVLVGEVLVHAGALVNGSTITQQTVLGAIEYFHLDLGPHDCVLANGAWAESYFEDRNRDGFHNAADFHARFPGHVPVRQETCLPIVTAGHPGLGALRAKLAPAEVRAAA